MNILEAYFSIVVMTLNIGFMCSVCGHQLFQKGGKGTLILLG